jgi:hypothetical protein
VTPPVSTARTSSRKSGKSSGEISTLPSVCTYVSVAARSKLHLVLTGTAGGTYKQGTGGDELELDAVEFCRILSGRGSGDGLLEHKLPP